MNILMPALPCFLLLASCSWLQPGAHAHIFRQHSALPQAEPVCIPMGSPGAASPPPDTRIPTDYRDFTARSNYPRTFRVWKNLEKMQAPGPRHVEIDLARQRGIFVVNDEVVMDFPVCTGTKRKPTPTGHFRITQKNIHHVSNIYDVPMPYFMRLTNYGIGMHVGDVFRAPASHGCIRLTREACIPLYRHAPSGTRVLIRRCGWSSEEAAPGASQALQLANAAG